MAYNNVSTV